MSDVYKEIVIRVYVPENVNLDDAALNAVQSAAGNEAYEQVQVWKAENGA